jgi:hypothetical protein
MTIAFRSADTFAAHAVCAAAGVRDGMRAAQFYIRDLSRADEWAKSHAEGATFLSTQTARLARLADRLITWGANLSIRLLLPSWRKLPSPFAPGILSEIATAIAKNSFVHNPLFNAYFFRAAQHILQRYAEPPYLVLEHRVDAARRLLAQRANPLGEAGETDFLARTLLALVETGPIARTGTLNEPHRFFNGIEPNVAVWAIACVTLLFAEEGRPIKELDEDEFFAVVGALIEPRLSTIADLVAKRDEGGLAAELADIKAMY